MAAGRRELPRRGADVEKLVVREPVCRERDALTWVGSAALVAAPSLAAVLRLAGVAPGKPGEARSAERSFAEQAVADEKVASGQRAVGPAQY